MVGTQARTNDLATAVAAASCAGGIGAARRPVTMEEGRGDVVEGDPPQPEIRRAAASAGRVRARNGIALRSARTRGLLAGAGLWAGLSICGPVVDLRQLPYPVNRPDTDARPGWTTSVP